MVYPKWTSLREGEISSVPARAHANDAGYDLTVSRDVVIEPGAFAAIPTNIAIALPAGIFALLVGRSSLFYKRGLLTNPGIIDPGYRGEIMALVHNVTKGKIIAHKGERLFQLVPIPQVSLHWKYLKRGKRMPVSDRGAAGVGSSGGYITNAKE